jgi:hypothetical protein
MSSFLQDHIDSDAILADIRRIVEIESPSRNVVGVNRVLEAIARFFEGTGAMCERQQTTPTLGDTLCPVHPQLPRCRGPVGAVRRIVERCNEVWAKAHDTARGRDELWAKVAEARSRFTMSMMVYPK